MRSHTQSENTIIINLSIFNEGIDVIQGAHYISESNQILNYYHFSGKSAGFASLQNFFRFFIDSINYNTL